MNEKIIFRHSSKSLSAINNVKLFEGEKNVDYLEFLIPPTYNDINILDCDIKLTYITPDNNEHYLLINDFVQEDTYKDCLRFVININENFTSVVGEIKMYLTFLKSDSKDIILKSSPTTIFISEHPYGKEGITEEQLNIIDEVLLRSKEALKIAQSVRNDADNGAFDGLSPIITISDINNGHKVDIEDKDGQKSFNVLNGENGKDGKDYVLTETDKEEIATSINAADKNIYGDTAINLGRKQDSEIGRNSIAYGDNVVASGEGSMTIGLKTQAIGKYAYASGGNIDEDGLVQYKEPTIITTVDGQNDLDEPIEIEVETSVAYGNESTSTGVLTLAYGTGSHAEGYRTNAIGHFSHIEGGKITNQSESEAIGYATHVEGASNVAKGTTVHAEGQRNIASGAATHIEGYSNTSSGLVAHIEGYSNINENGDYVHIEGSYNQNSNAKYSHIEGYKNIISDKSCSHTEGGFNTSNGTYSHIEGYKNTVNGYAAHAEGGFTESSEQAAHAEGGYTIASGQASHSEGGYTIASGIYSHAEGNRTTANGIGSHSSGYKTIAGYNYQFVLGIANENKEDNLFEIGNGSVTQNPDDKDNPTITRSNAFEVDKDGTVTAAKDFKVGDISLIEKIKQIDEELNGIRYLIIGNAEEVFV